MRVGIISDTHNLLRPAVLKALSDCDFILHGGDVSQPEILEKLEDIAPLFVVRGNNDKEWAVELPHRLYVTLNGIKFFMVHNKKDVPADLGDTQVVIFGHSHKYFEAEIDGRLWLNPGSCGKRRFDQEITMAILTDDDGQIHIEKLTFEP